jgi:hypothetical protein
MSRDAVVHVLGEPIWVQRGHEIWIYHDDEGREVRVGFGLSSPSIRGPDDSPCDAVQMMSDQIQPSTAQPYPTWIRSGPFSECRGLTRGKIRERFGDPIRVDQEWAKLEAWHYSHSPSGSHYIEREVHFDRSTGRVDALGWGVHWD